MWGSIHFIDVMVSIHATSSYWGTFDMIIRSQAIIYMHAHPAANNLGLPGRALQRRWQENSPSYHVCYVSAQI